MHKGRSQSGGDTGDRSVLCWQQYNFLLENVVRKTNAPQKQLLQEGWQYLRRRDNPCLWRCLPPSEITWSPPNACTQYPEQRPHKDDHIQLENSPSRPTTEHCSLLFSKGKETNRKETLTWKHDLTSRPWRTQLFFPTSAASETLSRQLNRTLHVGMRRQPRPFQEARTKEPSPEQARTLGTKRCVP